MISVFLVVIACSKSGISRAAAREEIESVGIRFDHVRALVASIRHAIVQRAQAEHCELSARDRQNRPA